MAWYWYALIYLVMVPVTGGYYQENSGETDKHCIKVGLIWPVFWLAWLFILLWEAGEDLYKGQK